MIVIGAAPYEYIRSLAKPDELAELDALVARGDLIVSTVPGQPVIVIDQGRLAADWDRPL